MSRAPDPHPDMSDMIKLSVSELVLLALFPAFVSCASTANFSGTPEELATELTVTLDEGRDDDADALFTRAARTPETRERVYPVLFDQAKRRYQTGEVVGSVGD